MTLSSDLVSIEIKTTILRPLRRVSHKTAA